MGAATSCLRAEPCGCGGGNLVHPVVGSDLVDACAKTRRAASGEVADSFDDSTPVTPLTAHSFADRHRMSPRNSKSSSEHTRNRRRSLGPSRPSFEAARLATMREVGQLDTSAIDVDIERILDVVCEVFDTETAWVSLLDSEGETTIRNGRGLCLPSAPISQTCVQWGVDSWSLSPESHQVVVIEDVTKDARIKGHPLAGTAHFFLSAPLVAANGHRIGTLSVVGHKPRAVDAGDATLLAGLAEMAVREVETRWALQTALGRGPSAAPLARPFDAYGAAFLLVDTASPAWRIAHINSAAAFKLALDPQSAAACPFWDMFCLAAEGKAAALADAAAEATFTLCDVRVRLPGTDQPAGPGFSFTFRPAATEPLDEHALGVGVPASVPGALCASRFFFVKVDSPAATSISRRSSRTFGGAGHLAAAFETLVLGPLLGTGGAKRVFRARLGERAVVARVVERPSHLRCVGGQPLEAELTASAPHPNLVQTFAHATVPLPPLDANADAPPSSMPATPRAATSAFAKAAPACEDLELEDSARGCEGAPPGLAKVTRQQSLPPPTELWQAASATRQSAPEPENDAPASLAPRALRRSEDSAGSSASAGAASSYSLSSESSGSSSSGRLPPDDTIYDSATSIAAGPRLGGSGVKKVGRTGSSPAEQQHEIWMLQELCELGSLREAIEKGRFHDGQGRPDVPTIMGVLEDIASAMAHLHAHGITHGELTGANVLLTAAPHAPHGFAAKVADFGMHRTVDVLARAQSHMYGSVAHFPPECILDHHAIDQAGDVYAFGIILWELVTGHKAWGGLTWPAIMANVAIERRREEFPPGVRPPLLKQLYAFCTAADPAARPTFAEIAARLRAVY